jgi:hypothetical protein
MAIIFQGENVVSSIETLQRRYPSLGDLLSGLMTGILPSTCITVIVADPISIYTLSVLTVIEALGSFRIGG